MGLAILLALVVGASIVVQNSVNAELMRNANLWLLLTAGNLLAALGSMVFFFTQRTRGDFVSEVARVPATVLVPGACAIAITAGMPVAINRIDVFKTIMLVIACQVVIGFLWDRFRTHEAVGPAQIVGALLVFGGITLILRPTG